MNWHILQFGIISKGRLSDRKLHIIRSCVIQKDQKTDAGIFKVWEDTYLHDRRPFCLKPENRLNGFSRCLILPKYSVRMSVSKGAFPPLWILKRELQVCLNSRETGMNGVFKGCDLRAGQKESYINLSQRDRNLSGLMICHGISGVPGYT